MVISAKKRNKAGKGNGMFVQALGSNSSKGGGGGVVQKSHLKKHLKKVSEGAMCISEGQGPDRGSSKDHEMGRVWFFEEWPGGYWPG